MNHEETQKHAEILCCVCIHEDIVRRAEQRVYRDAAEMARKVFESDDFTDMPFSVMEEFVTSLEATVTAMEEGEVRE